MDDVLVSNNYYHAGYPTDYDEDWRDMYIAATFGQYDELQEFIQRGKSVNTPNEDGITPLHATCSTGEHKCTELLIKAGAAIDARNIDGSTPLCDAASYGSVECVNLLLEAGAATNPPLNLSTALHEAVLRDQTEIVSILVKAGCRLEATDCHYGTPLHAASVKGNVDCAKVLLDAGANVNATKLHETPLHYAALSQNPQLVILLLNYGADLTATDTLDRRPSQRVNPNSPCGKVLKFYEDNPMLLSQLCRLKIRRSLQHHSYTGRIVSQLGLPKTLQSYLLDMR